MLHTEKNAILESWVEYFISVLNTPWSINVEAIAHRSLIEIKQILSSFPKEFQQKKPGSDSIPDEVFKAGGPVLLRKLTELFSVQMAEGSHSSRPHGSLHCPPL